MQDARIYVNGKGRGQWGLSDICAQYEKVFHLSITTAAVHLMHSYCIRTCLKCCIQKSVLG